MGKALCCLLLWCVLIILGLYLGIWVMFIGGIVDVIHQVKAPQVDAVILAIAIAKIVFFEVPIGICFWGGFALSVALGFGISGQSVKSSKDWRRL